MRYGNSVLRFIVESKQQIDYGRVLAFLYVWGGRFRVYGKGFRASGCRVQGLG